MAEANATIARSAEGDASAVRDVNKALQPPKDGKNEGSWLRAILLARLGLGEAATREFALLGVGSTEQNINVDGKRGVITMDAKGSIVKGYVEDKEGETRDMTAEEVQRASQIAEGVKKGVAAASRVRDSQGTEWSQVPTSAGTIFYNNKGERGVPAGKTVPISVGGDVDLQNQLQLSKLRNQLQFVEPTKRMEFAAQFDQENGTNFSATLKQTMPQFFGGTTPPPAQGTTPPPAQGTTPPPAQGTTPPPAQGTTPPPAQGTTPRPVIEQQPTDVIIPPNVALTVAELKPFPNESASDFAARKKAAAGAQAKYSELRAEDIAKIQANLPALESKADQMLRDTDALINHPAFQESVGLKGASTLFGLKEKPFAGTAAADWYSRYQQVRDKSFLQAFDSLRGGGQITNIEGEKATSAYNRMTTASTEKEFLDAKRDFDNSVKETINNSRAALGLPKKHTDIQRADTDKKTELFDMADAILKSGKK
jgi:hypothetical protein